MKGGAWCNRSHDRAGLVSNQDPQEPYNPEEPYASVAVCDRVSCINKGIRHVAGATNRTAVYVPDGWQKARPAASKAVTR